MYYPPRPSHWCYRSGPSRLLWFLIGAGVTLWWTKRHDRNFHLSPNCTRHRLPPPPGQADSNGQNPGWPQNMSDIPRAINSIPPGDAPASPSGGTWPPRDGWRWDPDRKQAVDAMVDLTESTLESVMSMAASLKMKLAEHRAQREKEQRATQGEPEEQRKNPPPMA